MQLFQTIIHQTDFDEPSKEAFRVARHLAQTLGADVAQFTPKTVETAEERQKLTFRVKAHIEPDVLKKYVGDVKTGLPGVAYVQVNPQAQWPARWEVKTARMSNPAPYPTRLPLRPRGPGLRGEVRKDSGQP